MAGLVRESLLSCFDERARRDILLDLIHQVAGRGGKREMRIPDSLIEVDDFRGDGAESYVLTHYHSDHRQGLKNGDERPILCSPETASLVTSFHEVDPTTIKAIRPGQTFDLAGGVRVTAYDANHCPGALMFLFEVNGRRHLHTGDFRYCAEHDRHPELFENIDTLFADCTYLDADEDAALPTQGEAIEQVLDLIRRHPEHKIFLGVYTVGKNRIVQAIHQELGVPVYLTEHYHKVYELLGMAGCVTRDRNETRIRAYAMGYYAEYFQKSYPNSERDSIVILPTGYTEDRGHGDNYFFIPYSEHNSTAELNAFLDKVDAREVVDINDWL